MVNTPLLYLCRYLVFVHIIGQNHGLLELGVRELATQVAILFLLFLLLTLLLHADYEVVVFVNTQY